MRFICNKLLFQDYYAFSFKARCKSVFTLIKKYGLKKYLKELWNNKDRIGRLIYLRYILGSEKSRSREYQSKCIIGNKYYK